MFVTGFLFKACIFACFACCQELRLPRFCLLGSFNRFSPCPLPAQSVTQAGTMRSDQWRLSPCCYLRDSLGVLCHVSTQPVITQTGKFISLYYLCSWPNPHNVAPLALYVDEVFQVQQTLCLLNLKDLIDINSQDSRQTREKRRFQ